MTKKNSNSECDWDENCKTLFQLIYAQANLYTNNNKSVGSLESQPITDKIDLIDLQQKIFYCPFLFTFDYSFENNQSVSMHELCRCISMSYKCDIEIEKEKNSIESQLFKSVYLILYIILILGSLFVNLLTSILLINEHKNINFINYLKCLCCCKKPRKAEKTNRNKNLLNNKQLSQIASLNSISDVLIFCLLISYMIITFYVIPNQIYLFFTNSNLINCKLSEFLKAFSVSLSIYSLVAISLQRFFAIKFSQYSCTLINTRLIDMISFISLLSFIKSIGIIIHTFLFSRTYRRYLITTLLMILIWITSSLIAFYHMSQYKEKYLDLKGYDFYEQKMACSFPVGLKTSAKFCTNNIQIGNDTQNKYIDKSDIFYMIFLLIIPNIIVLISYTWVCYHIWSQGSKLNMNSFRIYYKQSKEFESQKVQIEQVKSPVKIINNNKISNETNSSIDSILKSKNESKTCKETKINCKESQVKIKHSGKVDNEILNKMLKASTTQSIQSYHQFSIKKRNMSVTITTFLMVMCFSLCWAPFFIFPIFYSKISDGNIYLNIKVIIHLIGYSSAIWNPIILIIKSKRFKVRVAKLIRRIFCCKKNKENDLRDNNRLKNENKRASLLRNLFKKDSSSSTSSNSSSSSSSSSKLKSDGPQL